MRTAVLALILSLVIFGVLALVSFFGFDLRESWRLFEKRAATVVTVTSTVKQGRAPEPVSVPSGTFVGPTGKPTLRGPSGPPPNE